MKSEFALRPYTRGDVPHVVELVNADAAQTVGVRRAVMDDAGNLRLTRYVPAVSETVVATNARNEIVGFAYLADKDQAIVSEVGGAVHPAYWGQGVGTLLLDWAQQRAHVLAQNAPDGAKTVLQANLFETEPTAMQLFEEAGFTRTREWPHLVIELNAAPEVPALAGDLRIREMDVDDDWDIVGPAMEEAQADLWGAIPLASVDTSPAEEAEDDGEEEADEPQDFSFSNAPGFCFIAIAGDTVVGGVLCNARLVERNDAGRVGSVFVRPAYRRQGIGRALMITAFKAFWQRGTRRIILDTDADSLTQAPKLYARLGMRLYRREYLYEKEVRPGKELRRLSL